jgi:hypothetical protein
MRIYQRSQPRVAIAHAAARARNPWERGLWGGDWAGRQGGNAPVQGGWLGGDVAGKGSEPGWGRASLELEAAAPPDSGCGGRRQESERPPRGKRKGNPVPLERMGFWVSGLETIVAIGCFNGRWIEEFGLWTRTMGSTSGDW